jgi:hypothetical protein
MKNIKSLFEELDKRINRINDVRIHEGLGNIACAEIKILGQMSLLVNEKISTTLSLNQTADLDAIITMEYLVKKEFQQILQEAGLIYDEDSYLIWIPKDATFEELYNLKNLSVSIIDPESALLSKAIKAPKKNKFLIREAIASNQFPKLVSRILANGGKIESFL